MFFNGLINYFKNSEERDTRFYYLSLIKEEDGYSIHGLWAQYNETSYPSFCRDVEFDLNNLTDILPELEKYWYSNKASVEDGDSEKRSFDEEFWKHEYEKHGSCVFAPMNEHDYFAKTLYLYYKAITDDLPDEFYNSETKKCLIPVSLDFEFIE